MTKYDIYLIWGKDCDGNILRYYGSTANFIKRKSQHKNNYKNWVKAGKPSQTKCSSVYILDNGDWKMEKISEIDGQRWEAKKLEGEYQKNNECVNVRKENRTTKEWIEDHKDILTEYSKQYRSDNKDKIAEQKKEYYNLNKENKKEKQKEWNEDNKEYSKQYYDKNKQAILEKYKEKIICECGTEVTKYNTSSHRKSKKHINLLSNNESNM